MDAFVNDRFVTLEEAVIPISDLAINRGYGVFDYCKTINNKPVFLDAHLHRFFHSAQALRLPLPFSIEAIKIIVSELLARNGLPNSGIRLTLTGGNSEDSYSIGKPNFIVTQQAFPKVADEKRVRGISLLSTEYQRQLPEIKTIDYLMPIWLHPHLTYAKVDDFLYHSHRLVSETPRANIFIVTIDDILVTPGFNVLAGITMQKIREIAKPYYKVESRRVYINEVISAKEVFITSTTKGILPVAIVDGSPIGDGTRPVSLHLTELLEAAIQRSIND